jgi:RHS repeat-associated protein
MPKASFLTMDGEILSQTRDGVQRDYLNDPLGSVAALLDSNQTVTDTFDYWPYGEERSRTGTTTTPHRYVGALGYYTEESGRIYVKVRHYQPEVGQWMSRDPLWPSESAYLYVEGNPTNWTDPSGMAPQILGCGPQAKAFLSKICRYVRSYIDHPKRVNRMNRCISTFSTRLGRACPSVTKAKTECFKRWCTNGRIECYRRGQIPDHPRAGGYAGVPGVVQCAPGGSPLELYDPRGGIRVGPNAAEDLQERSGPYPGEPQGYSYGLLSVTMLHEIGHKCGVAHGIEDREFARQCNDIWSYCVYRSIWPSRGQ